MQIMGDSIGPDIENRQQMVDRFFEEANGCDIVQATDVLR